MKLRCLFIILVWEMLELTEGFSLIRALQTVNQINNFRSTSLFAEDTSRKSRKRRREGASEKTSVVEAPKETLAPGVSSYIQKDSQLQDNKNAFAAFDKPEGLKFNPAPLKEGFSFGEFGQRLSTLKTRVDLKEAEKSALPPLSGTLAERQAKYNEKNPILRFIEEQTAPTLPGEEPKSIKLAKTVAWAGVLTLAFIELVVSVKVGGMPFEVQKISFGFKTKQVTVDVPVPKPPPVKIDAVPFDSTLTGPRSIQ